LVLAERIHQTYRFPAAAKPFYRKNDTLLLREPVFKQILGGCTAVVEGLGALRNRLGDAHGGGIRRVRPLPRHAQLAVNLAGSMTSFLVATWEARKGSAANQQEP
jgi:hypothetical protein